MSYTLKANAVEKDSELPVHPSNIIHTESYGVDSIVIWYYESEKNE